MSPARRPCSVLASAMLVAVALAATPEALHARNAKGSAAQDWERRSAQAESARHAQEEQRWRLEQAHAQMPDTMYASTPDPSPPHPFLLDAGTEVTPERSARVPARAEVRLGHRVGLFPSAARWTGEKGYQGFVRVINRSDDDGEVRIDAWDDTGEHAGPVTLAIGAGETKHFNSEDLEEGNAGKGLSEGIGAGEGDWRLEFTSTLDIEVLGYIRTGDGFLTSVHDVAPATEAGHRVVTFNPGSNVNQASRLRVVNPGTDTAEVSIEGTDDDGVSSHGAVEFTLAPGASRTLSAKELESGEAQGLGGALGTGEGKWRLTVTAKQPIEVMSLLWSPTGHLTNLSTVPDNTGSGEDGVTTTHSVALFPSASDPLGRPGFVRVVSRGDHAGEVHIDAWDDEGTPRAPVTLAIGGGETKHFNSEDLETGNSGKGLDGSTGSGEGDWRLVLTSTLELDVLGYIRTEDGFLTAVHDVAPSAGAEHRVVTFNPGRNVGQVSRLRVINRGAETAEVRIEGTDDDGRSSDGAVEFTLAPEASRTLKAKELESGEAEGLSGALGTGGGKWQLRVTAEQPIEVMSLLSSPTGHLTNLSTTRGKVVVQGVGETAAEVFREHISGPIVQSKCVLCHVKGGQSGNTRLVFLPLSNPDHEAHNLQVFKDFLADVDDGATYILNKIQGVAHGGGVQVAAGTADYENMERFLGLLGEDVTPVTLTPQTLFDTVTMAPVRKTLRRAALIFAGRTPTDEEYAAAQGGGAALRATIRGLMTGPEFHEFLIRGANDRLLTDRRGTIIDHHADFLVDFSNEAWRRASEGHARGDDRYFYDWNDRVQHGARRAPLELIAHVVENDLPYTEVLTADYVMANPMSAEAFGAPTRFDDPEDPHEFKPSRIVSYYRHGDGFESEYDPVIGATRVLEPGPLRTAFPHAGILNTSAFLIRYPTTATNRNRARSRWTYYHFLGLDIEKSASRTTDPVALADTNNPTLRNPACTVCHRVLDPVAGAFQNYKDQWRRRMVQGPVGWRGLAGRLLQVRSIGWRGLSRQRTVPGAGGRQPRQPSPVRGSAQRTRPEEPSHVRRRHQAAHRAWRGRGSRRRWPGGASFRDEGCGRRRGLRIFQGLRLQALGLPRASRSSTEGSPGWHLSYRNGGLGPGAGDESHHATGLDAGAVLPGRRHLVPRHACSRLRRQVGAESRQQRAVAGEADRRRKALRRGDGRILVAGRHGQRSRRAPRGRRGCGLRGVVARRQCPGRGGGAVGQRIPARLPGPGSVQPQGSAGRDRPLPMVPGGRCGGRAPGSPGRPSRRRREAAAHTGGARAQDRSRDGCPVGTGNRRERLCKCTAAQRVDRGLSASLRRHRLGRNHRAGAGRHVGDGRGGQATRRSGELSRRNAGLLPLARCRAAIVRGHRSASDAGSGAERHVRDRSRLVCPPGDALPQRSAVGGTHDRAIDLSERPLGPPGW